MYLKTLEFRGGPGLLAPSPPECAPAGDNILVSFVQANVSVGGGTMICSWSACNQMCAW